jgi:hypothetical protein
MFREYLDRRIIARSYEVRCEEYLETSRLNEMSHRSASPLPFEGRTIPQISPGDQVCPRCSITSATALPFLDHAGCAFLNWSAASFTEALRRVLDGDRERGPMSTATTGQVVGTPRDRRDR